MSAVPIRMLAASCLVAGLWHPGSGLSRHAETGRLSRTLTFSPDKPIVVEATVGAVAIKGSDRPDIAIEIVTRAPTTADLARLEATIEDGHEALRIRAVQIDQERDAAVRGDISIDAPVSALFRSVRVFEGTIDLTNLQRAIAADIRRGSIRASSLAGTIRLEAGIGDVTVRLTRKDRFGPRVGEATLGDGEPLVSIDVVTGNVRITTGRTGGASRLPLPPRRYEAGRVPGARSEPE